MGNSSNGVVQSFTAAGKSILRSVNLLRGETPAGVTWKTKDPRKEYKFQGELGHGNYGVVHLVTHTQSGRMFACKILRREANKEQQRHLMAEVAALHKVGKHPNIAELHEVWEYAGYLYLFMEACLGGELFDVIMHRGHFSERDAAVVAGVVLEVVAYCHGQGVAHRDLKPENFLLKRKALDARTPLRAEDLRLVDFGLAVFMEPGKELTELLGSPFYVAPELLKGCYSYPADVWSAGVILYILLSGLPPFQGNNERDIFRRVLRQPLDLHSEPWPSISAEAKNLVSRMLERDPRKRITAEEGCHHGWLRSAVTSLPAQSALVMQRLRAFSTTNKLQGLLMNVIAKNMSTDGIDALRDVFDALDTNRDGYLSFEELRQGMEDALGESDLGSTAAQGAMDALDVSGDGYIEYHEFLAAVVDRQRTLTDHTIAEMFALLDKNHDGEISAQELSAALEESNIQVGEESLRELMMVETPSNTRHGGEPMLTKDAFSELLRGSLRQETLQLSHLEGALSDMQHDFRVRNRFRQLALLVIARDTPVAELTGLRELFESLDVDNSGQLSMEELRRGLKKMDSQLSDDEIEALLEFMDVDGDHMVDYHEFIMGTLEDKQLLTEAKLRTAFNFFDNDRNGHIDISEVERVVKELGITWKQNPQELLAIADINDDEVVDFSEFRSMMLSAEPNILINRQQSLLPQRTSGNGSTLSSRSSRASDPGSAASPSPKSSPFQPNSFADSGKPPLDRGSVGGIHSGSQLAGMALPWGSGADPATEGGRDGNGGANESQQVTLQPRRSRSELNPASRREAMILAGSHSARSLQSDSALPLRRRQLVFASSPQLSLDRPPSPQRRDSDVEATITRALSSRSFRRQDTSGEQVLLGNLRPTNSSHRSSGASHIPMLDPVQEDCALSVGGGSFAPECSSGVESLAVVLGFMEDQWSRTSLLVKQGRRMNDLR